MPSNSKSQIIKIVLLVTIFIIVGFLVYNNFIKKKKTFFYADESMIFEDMAINESINTEFNFDFFEDEVFKSLIKSEQVKLPTANELGRENPFLSF